jgi:uncharacterized protein
MKSLHLTCLVLTIVGALNWGLWGLFQFDLVATLFDGQNGTISRIVYSLVGLAGLCLALTTFAIYGRAGKEAGVAGTHVRAGH